MDEKITPNVRDEFGTLKVAMVSPFSAPEIFSEAESCSLDDAKTILTHPFGSPDIHAHFAFTELLRQKSVQLLYPHPPHTTPTRDNLSEYIGTDIYCRDFLGVVDQQAILSNVIEFRNKNRIRYEPILHSIAADRVARTHEVFTWGNAVLHRGNVLVGLEHNQYFEDIFPTTNQERFQLQLRIHDQQRSGINAMRNIFQEQGVEREIIVILKNSNEDLDCGLAPLPRRRKTDRRRALALPSVLHTEAVDIFYQQFDELVPMEDPRQSLGCNILWLDPETPVVSAEARKTIRALRNLGYNPIPQALGTLKFKGIHDEGDPGGWRCMTGVLERANDYDGD